MFWDDGSEFFDDQINSSDNFDMGGLGRFEGFSVSFSFFFLGSFSGEDDVQLGGFVINFGLQLSDFLVQHGDLGVGIISSFGVFVDFSDEVIDFGVTFVDSFGVGLFVFLIF